MLWVMEVESIYNVLLPYVQRSLQALLPQNVLKKGPLIFVPLLKKKMKVKTMAEITLQPL